MDPHPISIALPDSRNVRHKGIIPAWRPMAQLLVACRSAAELLVVAAWVVVEGNDIGQIQGLVAHLVPRRPKATAIGS